MEDEDRLWMYMFKELCVCVGGVRVCGMCGGGFRLIPMQSSSRSFCN